ncbi:tyrosine-type recombinase/integrase [Methylobacterium sp. E-016]|uniref:tyrosine-type recombinase/integrase n=1 Tax=Methylobacterium sp. E-016 TaxID=2836556 RepID=UPI001FBA0C17|nr:tyrosine-type recombinase/integrase [Methylobacterium sp. E-016]MCJ2074783.1 tyrosine-type recombinase/integrase [Methylobacterium sp. E-016]
MSNALVPIVDAEFEELPLAQAARGEGLPAIPQADGDDHLVEMWIAKHTSPHTRRNYAMQARRFRSFVGKPLRLVRIGDVQAFMAGLGEMAPATRATAIAAVKSLLTFGQEVGFLQFNVGKAVKAPPIKNKLAERIMSESDAMRMVALVDNPRDRAFLTLLYGGGLRISEACALRWKDLAERDGGAGQATVFGKGGKTRAVLLSPNTWRTLHAQRGEAGADDPVFRSRKGGVCITTRQADRIVGAAAARAGLSAEISAHWLRHAHASHALDRGAPIHLVQATLGHASVATTGRYLHARPSESSARFLGV